MKAVLIFVDGLGIGGSDPEINPCLQPELNHLNHFFQSGQLVTSGSGYVLPLDATLDVAGLPQSATGQTALLTGKNAALYLGKHLPGFPNQALRDLLKKHALPKILKDRGCRPVFINAYRPEFFKLPQKLQWRMSVTTIANLSAGLPFKSLDEIKQSKAIYHDFTNRFLIRRGYDIPEWTPEAAGTVLAALQNDYDFILYEYFLTDRIGHLMNAGKARQVVSDLDRFLSSFLAHVNLEDTLVIVTSDHGNIEDVSVKTHTRNPAMTLVFGKHSVELAAQMKSILDISPAILRAFGDGDG